MDADRLLKLRKAADDAKADVARVEALAGAAEQQLADVDRQIAELGFDPAGDLEAQMRQAETEVRDEVESIQKEVTELKAEAGL